MTSMHKLVQSSCLLCCFAVFAVLCVQAQTPQATPPPPAQPRSVTFPKPVEETLPNGLRVIVIERQRIAAHFRATADQERRRSRSA